jgi:hypothetical protein
MSHESESESESVSDEDTIPFLETELQHFHLTHGDLRILQQYRQQWQNAKGSARTAIAVEAYEEMLARDSSLRQTSQKAKEIRKLKRQVSF